MWTCHVTIQHYCFLGQANLYRLCGKWQLPRLTWPIFLVQNGSNYFDLNLKVITKDDFIEFRLVQNLTMGEADSNQFMRLRNQLVIAAEKFVRMENLSPALIPRMSKDMDEQLKLAHKVVDLVDWANRKICVTLLRYSVDKRWSSFARIRLSARKKAVGNYQKIVCVKFGLTETVYLLE